MIAGLNLSTEGESKLAILSDETRIISMDTNEEIMEAIPEKVDILAVNAPLNPGEGLTEKEEELVDEGHQFSPSTQNKTLGRRAMHLKQLMAQNKPNIEFIRYDPMLTSKELAIDGDDALKSYGISIDSISSSSEFDAVLGAVTARFYQEGACEDLGVQVPTSFEE